MAITSVVIGNLGAGKVTTVPFTYDGTGESASDIDSTWNIPAGSHLFFWEGINNSRYSSKIIVDGTQFEYRSSQTEVIGFIRVEGPKTIQATGDGPATYTDLYANWVRIAS